MRRGMTTIASQSMAAPSRLLRLAESRVLWETGAGLALWPLLQLAPRGDGHPVLVLPGLTAGDMSTKLLRLYLKSRGNDAHGWNLGCNLGPREGVEDGLLKRLESLHAETGRKVSLVGWSLGGVYARLLASTRPELVRSVITLGCPFTGDVRATNAWRLYEGLSGHSAEDPRLVQLARPTPAVPTTSIYSRSDGMVAWRCCVEQEGPHSENIEVVASHRGLGSHPAVLYAVADRLAQPPQAWKHWDRGTFGRLLYPRKKHAKKAD